MATEKVSGLTATTVLTTEMDALADAAFSSLGSVVVDNGTDLNTRAIAELTVQFGTSPTDFAAVELYLVPAPDGTNYGSTTGHPASELLVGTFIVRAGTNAQRLHTRQFLLPPCKFKLMVKNAAGFAFPASGSVVKLHTFNRTVG